MKTEDLVSALDELSRCWKLCNKNNSPMLREIRFWRLRFLDGIVLEEDFDKIRKYFMSMPCDAFVTQSPEETLSDIRNHIKE